MILLPKPNDFLPMIQYGSVKGQAELRMRKEGASTRPLVSLGTGFLEGNFDTRFLTTLGLLL
jgi:hypothetical protein